MTFVNDVDIGLTIEPAFDEPDDEMHIHLMNINNRNKLAVPEKQVTLKPSQSKTKIKGQVNAARENPRFKMRLDRAEKLRLIDHNATKALNNTSMLDRTGIMDHSGIGLQQNHVLMDKTNSSIDF